MILSYMINCPFLQSSTQCTTLNLKFRQSLKNLTASSCFKLFVKKIYRKLELEPCSLGWRVGAKFRDFVYIDIHRFIDSHSRCIFPFTNVTVYGRKIYSCLNLFTSMINLFNLSRSIYSITLFKPIHPGAKISSAYVRMVSRVHQICC